MKVLVTGAHGFLGHHVATKFRKLDYVVLTPRSSELDLRNSDAILDYLNFHSPSAIVHCAARVGGISANLKSPGDFILDNLQIDSSLLAAARLKRVEKFVYMGSSCMYPKNLRQPLIESDILSGPLEDSNEGYAVAKISGAMATAMVSRQDGLDWKILIPSNLYGPGDNFEEDQSHLVAAIVRKLVNSKKSKNNDVEIWGSGKARREFTYAPDVADFIAAEIDSIKGWPTFMNIGIGIDYSILEFYEKTAQALGLKPNFNFDLSKPEGMKRKLMDSSLAQNFGWNPKNDFSTGIKATIEWYEENAK